MLASPRIPPKFLLIGLLGGLAIIGMIAIAIITREGSRITPDSVVYVSTARSFMGAAIPQLSTGLFVPAAHFPPLYPALLALAATLTATDPLVAARLLDIFFFGITLALVGGMTYQFTRKVWVAGLTVFFVLSQPQMLRHFGTNASEPLFIVCLLAMLWLLLEERILWAALFAALAFLTRYIGIALIAAGVCGLLLFSAYNWRLRFRKAAVFGGIGITPTLLWLVYNLSVTGKLANRSLALHLIESTQFRSGINALSGWFLLDTAPITTQGVVLMLIIVGILAMIWAAYRRNRKDQAEVGQQSPLANERVLCPPRWIALISALYVVGLVVTMLFLDSSTPLDDRLLLPLFPLGTIALACLLSAMSTRYSARFGRALRIAGWAAFGSFAVLYALAGLSTVAQGGTIGQNYADAHWVQSPLLAQIKTLKPGTLIITNTPEMPYLYATQPIEALPLRYDPTSLQPNVHYAEELAALRSELSTQGALLVYWRETYRPYYPSEYELFTQLSLDPIFEANDGALYRIKPTP